MPLSFVVGLSMIKDGFEDYQRYRSDDEENHRTSECVPIGKQTSKSQKVDDEANVAQPITTSDNNLTDSAANPY